MVASFYDADKIIGTAYCKACSFAAGLASSVYRYQEVMASAFYIERYFPVVAYYDRAYVEAVRSDCRKTESAALGHQYRSAHT